MRLFAVLLWLGIPATAFAQLTITGAVTDERGEPLPGASIGVVGHHHRHHRRCRRQIRPRPAVASGGSPTRSAVCGLPIRPQRTIRQNDGSTAVVFQLAVDALQLDEIVVTGLSAAASRKQLGHAISTVSARQLATAGTSALDKALTGKLAGALVQQNSGNPAGGATIRLRGTSTVLGDADPLYVVDGVVVNNSSPELIRLGGGAQNRLGDLNPNDVERIEVVKGAAAAALYGSRANNGVVQIFTKRGALGKPQLTYTARFSTAQVRKTLAVNKAPVDNNGDKNPDGSDVQRFDHQDFIFRRAAGTEHYVSAIGRGRQHPLLCLGLLLSRSGRGGQ